MGTKMAVAVVAVASPFTPLVAGIFTATNHADPVLHAGASDDHARVPAVSLSHPAAIPGDTGHRHGQPD